MQNPIQPGRVPRTGAGLAGLGEFAARACGIDAVGVHLEVAVEIRGAAGFVPQRVLDDAAAKPGGGVVRIGLNRAVQVRQRARRVAQRVPQAAAVHVGVGIVRILPNGSVVVRHSAGVIAQAAFRAGAAHIRACVCRINPDGPFESGKSFSASLELQERDAFQAPRLGVAWSRLKSAVVGAQRSGQIVVRHQRISRGDRLERGRGRLHRLPCGGERKCNCEYECERGVAQDASKTHTNNGNGRMTLPVSY